MIDTTAEKLVCEIITTRSEELPKLNDLCSNSVHPFFIWTQNHIEGDVLNKLAEYKSTVVNHLHFTSDREIEDGCYVIHKNRILQVSKNNGNYLSVYEYPNIDIRTDSCKRVEGTTDLLLDLPIIDSFDVKTFASNEGKFRRVKIKISKQKNTIQVFAYSFDKEPTEIIFSSLEGILNKYVTHKDERDMLCDLIGDKVLAWYKSDNENTTQAGNLVIQELNEHNYFIVRGKKENDLAKKLNLITAEQAMELNFEVAETDYFYDGDLKLCKYSDYPHNNWDEQVNYPAVTTSQLIVFLLTKKGYRIKQ